MASTLSLLSVTTADFRTTKLADELNTKLMVKLGLRSRYEPARLAMGRSLAVSEAPPTLETAYEDAGRAILGTQLFGSDVGVWVSLFVEHSQTTDLSLSQLKDAVRRHWHRGIHLLNDDWLACGEDFDSFLLRIAELAGASTLLDSGQGESQGIE
jgi:hypothetical protein